MNVRQGLQVWTYVSIPNSTEVLNNFSLYIIYLNLLGCDQNFIRTKNTYRLRISRDRWVCV